jgi:hypothetical protein
MSKPPSNVKECVKELITVIEEVCTYNAKDRAKMIKIIQQNLMAYLKLKEWATEDSVEQENI